MVTSIVWKHVVRSANTTESEKEFLVVCIELEAYQEVIYNKKGYAVTARWRERLIAEEFNAGHCWILVDLALTVCEIYVKLTVS